LEEIIKGRGSNINPENRFNDQSLTTMHIEGIDEPLIRGTKTSFFIENPKNIISKNNSPDIPYDFSINPYQGCEHGCAYCYARNSHEYWGFSAGLDFETKIIVKPSAPQMLREVFLSKSWKPSLITLSGNTDCYQPIEKKLKITRNLLKVFAEYLNPVSIITKNVLILRDIDILSDLAANQLVHIFFSITTIDEDLRQKLEPRTASADKKLKVIEKLSQRNIPVGVMAGPIIPGLNNHEIPTILRLASEHGAMTAGFSMIRLNGAISQIFKDWIIRNFPERFNKIWEQICSLHGGKVSDSVWGRRMRGEGNIADTIRFIFNISRQKYFKNKVWPDLNYSKFRFGGNLNLFDAL
jgi:DNA repair photolyase